jgi:hypothetical protein
MFYKHYRGGIYYTLGFVHQEELDKSKMIKGFKAKREDTLEEVDVYMYDGEFHAEVKEEMVLYLAQDGQLWLRNSKDFYGYVDSEGHIVNLDDEDSRRRFKLM